MRHYMGICFPECFPRANRVGKLWQNEQPTLDEIWEWLGDPDDC